MTLYITKSTQKHGSREYAYVVLRENSWDRERKAMVTRHIANLSPDRTLTESKVRAICEAKGLTLEQLKAVRGLQIIPDDQAPSKRTA